MAIQDKIDLDELRKLIDREYRPECTLIVPPIMRQEMVKQFETLNPVHDPQLGRRDGLQYMGYKVVQADIPPVATEDWSNCRSPARAKRRRAQGHPQKVVETRSHVGYLIDAEALLKRFNRELENVLLHGTSKPEIFKNGDK